LSDWEKNIEYAVNSGITAEELSRLFECSGIRRPFGDLERLHEMIINSNLIVTARTGGKLIGVARALTDFSYCCYLSDLAVDSEYQRSGIGKKLVNIVRESIGDRSMLLLLSAPEAMDYYPGIGFDSIENAFMIKRKK
jgi:ribosomal protein S18 acetylase RimI-like enzyme